MINIKNIADNAELIVNGYAFTRYGENFKVLNLNNPTKASLITKFGEVLETSMDDIEIDIVNGYFNKNRKYLEA